MNLKILLVLLLISTVTNVKGVVEISPSGVTPVCQAGDQLELTCTVPGMFLRWKFTVTLEDGTSTTFMPEVTAGGGSGVPPPRMVNSTSFTSSRLSTRPLTSRMTINPVSEGLNGVQMNCVDIDVEMNEMTESATTTIQIIGAGDTPRLNLSIRSHFKQFTNDGIAVLLEWTISLSQSYYQWLLENVSINVVPDPGMIMTYTGNRTLQLTLQYNTLYNASITQPGICGQPSKTAFMELNYSKCNNPLALLTHNNVRVMGYEDPALEGERISFTCTSGLEVSGPNSSTCKRNGEWEPDPREVNCSLDELQPTNPTVCGHPLYVLQIRDYITIMSYEDFGNTGLNNSPICCLGILVLEATTVTCLEEELNTTQVKFEVNDRLRTELISVSCVLILVAALMLLIGFVSGHCFNQRYRKRGDRTTNNNVTTQNPTEEQVDDLELSKNVAYITLHPR